MKPWKNYLFATIAVVLLAFAAFSVWADTTLLLGSLTSVTTVQTNSSAVVSGTFAVPRGTFIVSTGGLAANGTNSQCSFEQISLDGTNWLTVAAFHFKTTNAASMSWLGGNVTNQLIYTRILSTNVPTITLGVTYGQ